jgi:hypothetical protein
MPNQIGGIQLGYIWHILLNGVLANHAKRPCWHWMPRTVSWVWSL